MFPIVNPRMFDRLSHNSTPPWSYPSSPAAASHGSSTLGTQANRSKRKSDDAMSSDRAQRPRTVAPASDVGSWHPRYAPDTIKVTFISNDKQKFSVEKAKIAEQVAAFRGAFSLPTHGQGQDNRLDPINVDETGNDLTMFFDAVGCAAHSPTPVFPDDMERLATLSRMAVKYDAAIPFKIAQYHLEDIIKQQPYKAFAYASETDDLDLGKQAIRSIRFKHLALGGDDFWRLISGSTPAWQLAFAKLVMPKLSRERAPDTGIKVQCNLNMEEIALRFEPEGVFESSSCIQQRESADI